MFTFNIAIASTSDLVAFYNENAKNPVKKFSSREVAEKRVAALIETLNGDPSNVDAFVETRVAELNAEGVKGFEGEVNTTPEVAENSAAFFFPKAADFIDAVTPVNTFVPVGFSSVFNPVNTPEVEVNTPEVEVNTPEVEVNTTPEVEVNTTPEVEVNTPEVEETPEEEAARIEAEANAEKEANPAVKASKGRSSNSVGVALSWTNPEVAKARLIRDGVTVTFEGSTSAYRSTREAFRAFRLPDSVHIRFRLKLKASRKETFEFAGKSYLFEII
jgi:hypothetical protein